MMRRFKRLLVFFLEIGVLLLGLILSIALGVAAAIRDVPEALFPAGLFLTMVAFSAVRRKTRPWKIRYDAAGWQLDQIERRLHPVRARSKRIAVRIFVWIPSLIAAGVLFFFPAASHLVRPSPQALGPYRLSIPWTLAIVPMPKVSNGSFVTAFALTGSNGDSAVTPFWEATIFSSEMDFGSAPAGPVMPAWMAKYEEQEHTRASWLLRKEFQLSGVALTCWQYMPSAQSLWQVNCETPVGVQGQHFHASFQGTSADLPAFYKAVERTVPIR
jgi:hypothetical protein